MSKKTKVSFDCENFDLYFANLLPTISPFAKECLPKDMNFKLFRKGGEPNTKNTSKLNFADKLWILQNCMGKRWWLVIEEDNGLSAEDFVKIREASKKKIANNPFVDYLTTSGTFVTGSAELADAFAALNYASVSATYNYISKGRNKIANKTKEHKQRLLYIYRFLVNYESRKKEFVSITGVSIQALYVLMALSDGVEIPSYKLQNIYKRAYQANQRDMKVAVRELCAKGCVEKRGTTNNAFVRITALGIDLLNQISDKYILNY